MDPNRTDGPVIVGFAADAVGSQLLLAASIEAERQGCPLEVLHQLVGDEQPEHQVSSQVAAMEWAAARNVINNCVRATLHDRAWTLTLITQPIGLALTERSVSATAIVIGNNHQTSGIRLLFDDATRWVSRHAVCPVIAVPAAAAADPNVIICGVDRSAVSLAAFAWASRESSIRSIPLHVVEVHDPGADRTKFDPPLGEWLATRSPGLATDIHTQTRAGLPADLLTDLATGSALVVVGQHLAGSRFQLRSVTRSLLAQDRATVVTIPLSYSPRAEPAIAGALL